MNAKDLYQRITFSMINALVEEGLETPFVFCTPKVVKNRVTYLVKRALTELRKQGVPSYFQHAHPIKTNYHREIVEAAFHAGSWIEVGSVMELRLIEKILENAENKDELVIFCNGLKLPSYLESIKKLQKSEVQVIPVLENVVDARQVFRAMPSDSPLGIRLRVPGSRFGLPYPYLLDFIHSGDLMSSRIKLLQVHVTDQTFLFDAQRKMISNLKAIAYEINIEHVEFFDVGGGIPQGLTQQQDLEMLDHYLIQMSEFLRNLQEQEVVFPTVISEAGRWVVSAAENLVFSVIGKEQEVGEEFWYYHVDGSFITDLIDAFLLDHRWTVSAMLPHKMTPLSVPMEKVYLSGLTLDEKDVYPDPSRNDPLRLPPFDESPYYLVFGNVGAYQENLRNMHNFHVPRPRVIFTEDGEYHVRQTAFVDDLLSRFGW